ncbi:MAG: Stp1/IreP family PP2C-type Ser/Thr phosphatase [Oscillospiraceae bacterium]|nr:Stp1/IreP family PP2C-type Ser/Thr phosphatase [Oscillospiraceae bacterium]
MELYGITDKGKVRHSNQDYFRILSNTDRHICAAVVCDGMGGAKAGNIASKLAADTFVDYLLKRIVADPDELALVMTDAVQNANVTIYDKSIGDPDCSGMGTTLVAAVVTDGGTVVLNVGDSRCYLINAEKITRVTCDHSVVEDLVRRGDITREEARTHPNRNLITRAVGTNPSVIPDTFRLSPSAGDTLLLCSDGLSNTIQEDEIKQIVNEAENLEAACKALVELSLSRGAPDNITAALLSI